MQGRVGGLHHGLFQNNVVLVICIGECYNDDIEKCERSCKASIYNEIKFLQCSMPLSAHYHYLLELDNII